MIDGRLEKAAEFLRRVPQQDRSKQKVLRVLASTQQLLPRIGYAELTVSPALVLRRAHVSAGAFYAYFTGMPSVFDVLTVEYIESCANRFADVVCVQPLHRWEDIASLLVDVHADFYRDPVAYELWIHRRLSGNLRDRANEADAAIAKSVQAALESSDLGVPRGDNEDMYRVAVELVVRLLELAFRESPLGSPRIISETKRAVIAYLGASSVSARGSRRSLPPPAVEETA